MNITLKKTESGPAAALLLVLCMGALAVVSAQFPPQDSWLWLTLLVLTALCTPPAARRVPLVGALLILTLLAVIPGLIAGHIGNLALIPWAMLASLSALAGAKAFSNPRGRRLFWVGIGFFILLNAAFAWYQRAFLFSSMLGQISPDSQVAVLLKLGRSSAYFVTANVLGSWMVILLPGLAEEILTSSKGAYRQWLTVCLVSALGALLLSQSLGAVLALVFAAILWFVSSKVQRHIFMWLVPVLVGTAMVVFRYDGAGWGRAALEGRFQLWRPAWELIGSQGWWGPGFGFSAYVEALREMASKAGVQGGVDPHNLFLASWAAFGFTGFLASGIFVALVLGRLTQVLRRIRWGSGTVGFALGVLVFVFHAQFSLVYLRPEIFLLVFALLGGALARPGAEKKSVVIPFFRNSFSSGGLAAVLLGVSLLLVPCLQVGLFQMVVASFAVFVVVLAAWRREEISFSGPWAGMILVGLIFLWQLISSGVTDVSSLLTAFALVFLANGASFSIRRQGHWMDLGLFAASVLSLLVWMLFVLVGKEGESLFGWAVLQAPVAFSKGLVAAVFLPLVAVGFTRLREGPRRVPRALALLTVVSVFLFSGMAEHLFLSVDSFGIDFNLPTALVLSGLVLALFLWVLERRRFQFYVSYKRAFSENAALASMVALFVLAPSLASFTALLFWMALFRRPVLALPLNPGDLLSKCLALCVVMALLFNIGAASFGRENGLLEAEQALHLSSLKQDYHLQAAADFEKAARKNGRFIDVRRALERHLSALNQSTESVRAYQAYASFLMRSIQWVPASALEKLGKLDPDWDFFQAETPQLRFLEIAQKNLVRATRIDTKDAFLWRDLALLRLGLSSWPQALDAANRALALEPNFRSALEIKLICLKKLGNTEKFQLSRQRLLHLVLSRKTSVGPHEEALQRSLKMLNR